MAVGGGKIGGEGGSGAEGSERRFIRAGRVDEEEVLTTLTPFGMTGFFKMTDLVLRCEGEEIGDGKFEGGVGGY